MIKLFWWLFKVLIWGNDLKIDFNFTVNFEEALGYLKKGYFIYEMTNENILYVKIKDDIYVIDTKKQTAKVIDAFTSYAINKLWKIIPERMQTEKKFLDKD